MMNSLQQALTHAIETGDLVVIRYNGGSQPGSTRRIRPISVSGDNVRARCLATNAVKVFKLSKMELQQEGQEDYAAGLVKVGFESLQDGINHYRDTLESMGWVVQLESESTELFRRFKNGKQRKTPDIVIAYHAETYCYTDFDDEGNQVEVTKPSTRPWYVSSSLIKSSTTFKKLGSAIEKFIEFATESMDAVEKKQ